MHRLAACRRSLASDVCPRDRLYVDNLGYVLSVLWCCFASQAVTFLKRIKEVVEDPRRLLLDV